MSPKSLPLGSNSRVARGSGANGVDDIVSSDIDVSWKDEMSLLSVVMPIGHQSSN